MIIEVEGGLYGSYILSKYFKSFGNILHFRLTNLSLFRSLSGELALVRREVESLRGICQGAGDRWGWIFLLAIEQIKCNCMFQKCPE